MEIATQINQMLIAAYDQRATDLYVMPNENNYLIKIHHHNKLVQTDQLSNQHALKLINYFKYRANMRISEHRRPQTGAMQWQFEQRNCYLRFSTVGDFKGRELIVIRLIYPLAKQKTGFLIPQQYLTLQTITKRRGLIVFAGPTGSGKTTTIYQLAKQYKGDQMVMTIEDPVEVYESSFMQLQVNNDAAMSYQELLKVGLRSRPDIFVIGEIRDQQTASAAVQAALSGHLVLTTVHAKSAFGVVQRLTNLGIEMQYLEQSLNAISYQRLLRTSDGGLKALLSIVTADEIFNQNINAAQPLEQWRANLDYLCEQNLITILERERVWYG